MQVQDGTQGVAVGKLIALLAEEGDDLGAIEVPSESSAPAPKEAEATSAEPPSSSASSPALKSSSSDSTPSPPNPNDSSAFSSKPHHEYPTHSAPLLPSVLRLLMLNNISDTSAIKPTGHKGMLTKGDVLAHLGKISSPRGSEKEEKAEQKHEAKPTGKEVSQ